MKTAAQFLSMLMFCLIDYNNIKNISINFIQQTVKWCVFSQGLLRLQSLFQELGERHLANDVIIRSRRIINISDSYELLRSVDRQELNCSSLYRCPCTRPIILDLSTVAAFNETRKQVLEHHQIAMLNLNYSIVRQT